MKTQDNLALVDLTHARVYFEKACASFVEGNADNFRAARMLLLLNLGVVNDHSAHYGPGQERVGRG